MKFTAFFLLTLVTISCNNSKNDKTTYKPGLGEFMFNIQIHHAKLWFAGENQNWQLADFEIHEIMEAIEDIQTFCSDRPEIKSLGMMNISLDSINAAINLKDTQAFKSAYLFLTNSCNGCHQATEHAFNFIKIPDSPPVSNQDFRVH